MSIINMICDRCKRRMPALFRKYGVATTNQPAQAGGPWYCKSCMSAVGRELDFETLHLVDILKQLPHD